MSQLTNTTLHLLTRGLCTVALVAACSPVEAPEAQWPPQAKMWFERAEQSYRTLDTEDAQASVEKALKLQPERPEVRLLAARIALASLDYDSAIQQVQGIESSDARAIRGRAYWYSGQVDEAAEQLEKLLEDPQVRDQWASSVVKLARTGRGRTPFTKSGDMLAVVEMPRLNGASMVVPVELNGQPVLAMIATGSTEVVVDGSAGREPSWISLRFDDRVEVSDVPALSEDLTALSRQLEAPIKVLLGSNLLRHLNVTFDYRGRQFVVRNYEPPPPPSATRLPIQYIRGGGMVLSSRIGDGSEPQRFNFFVDTGSNYPLVLDEPAWTRTRVPASERSPADSDVSGRGQRGAAGVTQAKLSNLQLGSYRVDDVTAFGGVPFDDLEQVLGIDLDGLLGASVLSDFRVTLTDSGRTMWLEDGPHTASEPLPPASQAPSAPAAPAAPTGVPPAG